LTISPIKTLVERVVQRAKEWRVPEHVRDLQASGRGLRGGDDAQAALERGRERLLDEHVVAEFERGDRGSLMVLLPRADQRAVGDAAQLDELLPAREAALRPDSE
jgi:hypothetical protein